MPDRERDLERELRDLGSHIEYPPTPGLARAARQRLEAEDEARANRRGRFWLPALSPRWAVAAMFVIVLAVPVLSPAARDTLSGMFVTGGASSGAGGAAAGGGASESADRPSSDGEAQRDTPMSAGAPEAQQESGGAGSSVPESAGGGQAGSLEASASAAAEDMPESGGGQPESGGSCSLGPPAMVLSDGAERITLREAQARAAGANCPLLLPRKPAGVRPNAVYKTWIPVGEGFSLVYKASPGLPAARDTEIGMVLTQFPGDIESTFLRTIPKPKKKFVEEVNVGNGRGYWVTEVHLDPVSSGRTPLGKHGRPRPRVNVLLWEQEGLSLRLESKLTREEAIRIAESVR